MPRAPKLLPLTEVAARLSTSERTARRMVERGDLHAVRLGTGRTSYRVPETALWAFLQQHGNLTAAELDAITTYQDAESDSAGREG